MTGSLCSSFRQPDMQAAAHAVGVGSFDGRLPSAPPSVEGSLLGHAASIQTQHSSGGSLVMPYMCACSPQIAFQHNRS